MNSRPITRATDPPGGSGATNRRQARTGAVSTWMAVVVTLALIAAACSDDATVAADPEPAEVAQDDGGEVVETTETTVPEVVLPLLELETRPGPFQVTIDAKPEFLGPDAVIEVSTDGGVVADGRFAEEGSALIRNLPPGPVKLQVIDGEQRYRPQPVIIPGPAVDDPSFYRETVLTAGYNYIPTRDGTTLSAFVTLPGSASDGPYPTLVEYSGYSPSNPDASDDPNRLLIPALGYALVQVNVRGTGCSGGSFDAFERIQSLDGYDVIETVAAQDWSAKIGMFGVSYPGIMQLHVASTRPPSLAAIAPLSVTDGVDSVLYPGGIYNDGFGENWSRRVSEQATAAGQDWAAERIARSDLTCANNQLLSVHNPDLVDVIQTTPYIDELSLDRSAETHAADINVPTLIGGAWQDEQTGGRFPALLDELENAPVLRAVMYNGLHLDAISGEMLVRIIEFFNLYVGDRSPTIDPVTRVLIGVGLTSLFGSPLTLPDGRYDGLSVEEARVAFEADPAIEILFEQGADAPNLPVPGFQARFEQWPPAETDPGVWYIAGATGSPVLSQDEPSEAVAMSFTTRPEDGQVVTIDDINRVWTDEPDWSWPASSADNAVIVDTEPLASDLVLVGNLSADLHVSVADGQDADLEVTVSEIGPDGSETYVQAGWLRLSRRALSDQATELRPLISGLENDVAPLEPGQPVLARVEVLPFAHVFRAGSRLRITIDTPGASRPQWRFDVSDTPVQVTVHSDADQPSRIVIPVIPDLAVTTPRPPCGNLRGQPCRAG